MKPKIIIADDSQTIQKVIKITLANEDYELVECLSDDNLLELTEEHHPSLVLLDYNLSENKTGYDLAKEIKAVNGCKILMLYGTFDTIDESLFDEAGINSHIVKPFDGTKFISLCQQLITDMEMDREDAEAEDVEVEDLGDFDETDSGFVPASLDLLADSSGELDFTSAEELETELEEFEEAELEEAEPEEAELEVELEFEEVAEVEAAEEKIEIADDWVVNQPAMEGDDALESEELESEEIVANEEIVSAAEMNSLESGMQDWGIDIPAVIGKDEVKFELPPVIGEEDMATIAQDVANDFQVETSFESGDVAAEEDTPEEIEEEIDLDKTATNLSLGRLGLESAKADSMPESILPQDDDLEYPDPITVKVDEASGPLFTPMTDLMANESNSQLEARTIELDATLGTDTEEEVAILEEQIADEVESTDVWHVDELEQTEKVAKVVSPVSESELAAKLDEMMAPLVEKIVREKIDAIIEKVSWEVIPDLAENLIKKELKQVSEQILASSGKNN